MQKEITIDELRKRKIFVATPMYGGQCHGMYTKSSTELATQAAKYGMDVRFFYLFNESLITRARNYLVDEFLRTDCTHMMFLDSDIGFRADDVLSLAAIAEPGTEYDIVGGPYPKKCIAWERVVAAVKAGLADQHGAQWLENIVGDFVFNPVSGEGTIDLGSPVEVLEGGTGFMMIQRHVFEKWNEAYPELLYTPDHNRSAHFDGQRKIMCYFDTVIEDEHNRYLSEDYMFCQWSRKIGLKIWMCPWMVMSHQGAYGFNGNLPAVSAVPNATHGGMLGQPLPGKSPAPAPAPAVDESLASRAARRREAAKKRREERKNK